MTGPEGLKAGKISKPYGLQGEVHMILIPSAAENIKTGTPLFIDLDGQRVPFFIESLDQVSFDQAIVKFEYIESIEEAKKVSGCDVYLNHGQTGETREETADFSGLVGYQVNDLELGALGIVSEYVSNVWNPVWLIDFRGKKLMVPATKEFIKQIDHRKQILLLDLPEGITNL